MRTVRLYEPQPLKAGAHFYLSEAASHHLGRVLRAKLGDTVWLFDGQGAEFIAEITEITKKSVTVFVTEEVTGSTESPLQIHLGQCLSKGERMDYAIQKSTELGVSEVTPLFSEHTEVKLPADRAEKRVRHWQQIAISACEQSYRTVVPSIDTPIKLEDWVNTVKADLKLVLDPRGAEPLNPASMPESVALLVGPEGGLSEAEVKTAVAAGFQPVVIGPRILRTETAPVAVISLLQYLLGDFKS